MLPGNYAVHEQDTSLYHADMPVTPYPQNTSSNPVLAQSGSNPHETTSSVPSERPAERRPKAVMSRRQ
jgi:hypothetical protein